MRKRSLVALLSHERNHIVERELVARGCLSQRRVGSERIRVALGRRIAVKDNRRLIALLTHQGRHVVECQLGICRRRSECLAVAEHSCVAARVRRTIVRKRTRVAQLTDHGIQIVGAHRGKGNNLTYILVSMMIRKGLGSRVRVTHQGSLLTAITDMIEQIVYLELLLCCRRSEGHQGTIAVKLVRIRCRVSKGTLLERNGRIVLVGARDLLDVHQATLLPSPRSTIVVAHTGIELDECLCQGNRVGRTIDKRILITNRLSLCRDNRSSQRRRRHIHLDGRVLDAHDIAESVLERRTHLVVPVLLHLKSIRSSLLLLVAYNLLLYCITRLDCRQVGITLSTCVRTTTTRADDHQ